MRILLRLVSGLAAVVIGAAAVAAAIVPATAIEVLDGYRERIDDPGWRIASGALGALLVLIPVAATLRWYASRRYAREISYVTEVGRVAVSLIAIEEALTRAIEQEPEVRKVQVRVYEDRVRRSIVCEAALTLWDDGEVSGVNRRCQQIMRSRFAELLPDQNAVQVHLTVHRLSHRRSDEPEERSARRTTRDAAELVDREREDHTPTRVPLPGLTATHGEIGNQAGAELLRAGRERRESTVGVEAGAAPRVEPPSEPAPSGDDEEEPGMYDDLYVGPNYPVDDDEEDSGAQQSRR